MLTPIDQPLDKLEDLTSEEMSALLLFSLFFLMLTPLTVSSENMKGWIEHFTNKYIICGQLVENDAGES